jgi:hypothetical protein
MLLRVARFAVLLAAVDSGNQHGAIDGRLE